LEYLDQRRITVREGDARKLLQQELRGNHG